MSESAFEERGREVEDALESLRATESESDELAETIEADRRETEEKLEAALERLRKLSEPN
jgi:F0F1-type ATP synthase membrane subunit b/b'